MGYFIYWICFVIKKQKNFKKKFQKSIDKSGKECYNIGVPKRFGKILKIFEKSFKTFKSFKKFQKSIDKSGKRCYNIGVLEKLNLVLKIFEKKVSKTY